MSSSSSNMVPVGSRLAGRMMISSRGASPWAPMSFSTWAETTWQSSCQTISLAASQTGLPRLSQSPRPALAHHWRGGTVRLRWSAFGSAKTARIQISIGWPLGTIGAPPVISRIFTESAASAWPIHFFIGPSRGWWTWARKSRMRSRSERAERALASSSRSLPVGISRDRGRAPGGGSPGIARCTNRPGGGVSMASILARRAGVVNRPRRGAPPGGRSPSPGCSSPGCRSGPTNSCRWRSP